MSSRQRANPPLVVAVALVAGVTLTSYWYRSRQGPVAFKYDASMAGDPQETEASRVPVLVDGRRVAILDRDSLKSLSQVQFVESQSREDQRGWAMGEVLVKAVGRPAPRGNCRVVFRSSRRNKAAEVSWTQLLHKPQGALLIPARRGNHFKVCGDLPGLSQRKQWVQWVTSIEVKSQVERDANVHRNR